LAERGNGAQRGAIVAQEFLADGMERIFLK
jgi:hypothetical protein